ncbi:GNAT family N-acetyltransferase [Devosia sp. Naph2]|uniref:GNAT family N-acetyltransferase n=1 Tax=Devosia polycyclovorans TaxID=3345148 RepID=UPI0035CF7D0C
MIGRNFHDDKPRALGYRLGPVHRGQGFAPEAAVGVLQAATTIGLPLLVMEWQA